MLPPEKCLSIGWFIYLVRWGWDIAGIASHCQCCWKLESYLFASGPQRSHGARFSDGTSRPLPINVIVVSQSFSGTAFRRTLSGISRSTDIRYDNYIYIYTYNIYIYLYPCNHGVLYATVCYSHAMGNHQRISYVIVTLSRGILCYSHATPLPGIWRSPWSPRNSTVMYTWFWYSPWTLRSGKFSRNCNKLMEFAVQFLINELNPRINQGVIQVDLIPRQRCQSTSVAVGNLHQTTLFQSPRRYF
jgi:hypothetical protein